MRKVHLTKESHALLAEKLRAEIGGKTMMQEIKLLGVD